jgi:hypothetical protein
VVDARRRARPRTTWLKEWADKYKGKFDDGWDAYRAGLRAAEGDGLDPGTPS